MLYKVVQDECYLWNQDPMIGIVEATSLTEAVDKLAAFITSENNFYADIGVEITPDPHIAVNEQRGMGFLTLPLKDIDTGEEGDDVYSVKEAAGDILLYPAQDWFFEFED